MPTTMHDFYTGDDIDAVCVIRKNGQPLVIAIGAIVRAAVIHNETKTIVGPVQCVSTANGADWENGVVVASFSAALSATMLTGRSTLEVEVNDVGIQTVQQDSVVVKQTYIA